MASELNKEVREFLDVASKGVDLKSAHSDEETSKAIEKALLILKNLPAARDAALEFFKQVIYASVSKYCQQDEGLLDRASNNTSLNNARQDGEAIEEVYESLLSLMTAQPEAWSPVFAIWSLRLLGRVSVRFSDKIGVPLAGELHEILHAWMSCPATKALVDLTIQCITFLSERDIEACINALLETSVEASPYFDWVVAHIGGCFPQTVIHQVMWHGLVDFAAVKPEDLSSSRFPGKSPKLVSVVGILSHLAGSYGQHVTRSGEELFNWSMSTSKLSEEQIATVPFLLHLCCSSPILLNRLTRNMSDLLTVGVLETCIERFPIWLSRYSNENANLLHMLLHITLRSEMGGAQATLQALKYASNAGELQVPTQVKLLSATYFETFLFEVAHMENSRGRHTDVDIPILRSLADCNQHLITFLTQKPFSYSWEQQAILRLINLITVHEGPGVATQTLTHLVSQLSISHIHTFLEFVHMIQRFQPEAVSTALRKVLQPCRTRLSPHVPAYLARNVRCVLIYEQKQAKAVSWNTSNYPKVSKRASLTLAIRENLTAFASLLNTPEMAQDVAASLQLVLREGEISPLHLFQICQSAVSLFFLTMAIEDPTTKADMWLLVQNVMKVLSANDSGRVIILRLLLETALSSKWSALFGAKRKNLGTEDDQHNHSASLIVHNNKYELTSTLPQKHNSVFHAGIIGKGMGPYRKGIQTNMSLNYGPKENSPEEEKRRVLNSRLLAETLAIACEGTKSKSPSEPGANSDQVFSDNSSQIALLLVELVSPDVMFNGLPWPDEEFTKVTMERDLQIWRTFEQNYILWDLLEFLARNRPSLCYCSVLLRALLAVLISFWGNCQEGSSRNCPKHLEVSIRLLQIMAIGQILPPPLSYVPEILPALAPYEILALLRDVWLYVRDHVPSPSLFNAGDGHRTWRDLSNMSLDMRYTERLRLILLANIHQLGVVYERFFPTANLTSTPLNVA